MVTQPSVEVPDDVVEYSADALSRGWSDGLPVIHPTEALVATFIEASGLPGSRRLGRLYPNGVDCTVELVAINAVMAGAPRVAMPLMCAAVVAMADPKFDLAAVNATTAPVVPALVVSGPVRDQLSIPYKHSAWGGVAGPAPAIGRALRLVMRNVAGQVPGQTSEAVFGQPARVTGIVTAEWLEESPWPSIGERRGISADSVTVFGALGTTNIFNSIGTNGAEILEVIGKSLAFMGNNNMDHSSVFAHQLVALNPTWAKKVYVQYPNLEDVQEILYKHANLPIDWFPASLQPALEVAGKVKSGRVYLMDGPDDVSVVVNGGKGGLHATMLPGMTNLPVTRSISSDSWDREA
jgi:hypothetical protein